MKQIQNIQKIGKHKTTHNLILHLILPIESINSKLLSMIIKFKENLSYKKIMQSNKLKLNY
jgi:hypothetical protein